MPPHRTLAPGSTLGNYRLEARLGRGGQAIVFLARDVVLHRVAAVKVFTDTSPHGELVHEGRLIARLSHPNVVSVYHLELSGPIRYLAMEYVAGGDLVGRIRRLGPLPPLQALGAAAEVLAGLRHAHEIGVIHRDVKPQNLLVAAHHTVKIADFGLATALHHALHSPEVELVGTPLYMAPEIWRGSAPSPASDLYSLGCVLHFMLTGSPPFAEHVRDALRRAHLERRPTLPDSAPKPVVRFVEHLMAKDPSLRPPTAAEALALCQECAAELGRVRAGRKAPIEATPAAEAEASILDLPPFAEAAAAIERALGTEVSLLTVTGSSVHHLERLTHRLLEERDHEHLLTAVLRLESEPLLDVCARLKAMLKTRIDDAQAEGRDLSAAIVKALAPEGSRRVVLLVFDRPFLPSEPPFLVELCEEAQGCNLCTVVVCAEGQADRLTEAVRRRGSAVSAELVVVPPATADEALAQARVWIRAAGIGPERVWSPSALALATELATHQPARVLQILQNAAVLASRLELPVLTTWCLRGGAAHEERLTPQSPLRSRWRQRPDRWPDAPELERWQRLPKIEPE